MGRHDRGGFVPRKKRKAAMNPYVADMFYRKLSVAMLKRARLDLDSKNPRIANDARLWFMTPDASRYAELACLNPCALRAFVKQLWEVAA